MLKLRLLKLVWGPPFVSYLFVKYKKRGWLWMEKGVHMIYTVVENVSLDKSSLIDWSTVILIRLFLKVHHSECLL